MTHLPTLEDFDPQDGLMPQSLRQVYVPEGDCRDDVPPAHGPDAVIIRAAGVVGVALICLGALVMMGAFPS